MSCNKSFVCLSVVTHTHTHIHTNKSSKSTTKTNTSSSGGCHPLPSPEGPVERAESRQLEHGVEWLLGHLVAPVPRGSQSAVNARPPVISASIKSVPEKVAQHQRADAVLRRVRTPGKCFTHILTDVWPCKQ